MASRIFKIALSFCVGGIFFGGCSSLVPQIQTIGQQFRSNLDSLEKSCAKRSGFMKRGDNSCDVLHVKPRSWEQTTLVKVEGQPLPVPAEWLATPAGRYAHAIVLPAPLSADSGYRIGMNSEEYFQHLCKKEAGQFIFKTVNDVEGIYQARPRKKVSDKERYHLYALEDPAGSDMMQRIDDNVLGWSYAQWIGKGGYAYLENNDLSPVNGMENLTNYHSSMQVAAPPNVTVSRFTEDRYSVNTSPRREFDKTLRARYGYTWRGIRRDMDRELGIAGGELLAIDFATSEVLAVYRYYLRVRTTNDRLGIAWEHPCPQLLRDQTRPLRSKTGLDFLSTVLQPL